MGGPINYDDDNDNDDGDDVDNNYADDDVFSKNFFFFITIVEDPLEKYKVFYSFCSTYLGCGKS